MLSINQQGISLIELMIAITLALILMAAAMQVLTSSRQTYELNSDIARIQENGRIAMEILVNNIRMAGYRNPVNGIAPDYFDFQTHCKRSHHTCTLDHFIDKPGSINHGSDRLSIVYDHPADDYGGRARDCLSTELTSSERTSLLINIYSIKTVKGISSLYCRGYNKSKGQWLETGAQPLIDGIDNMQVLYGIASDTSGSVRRYVSQDQLSEQDWALIKTVKIALLVSNGLTEGFADAKSRKYRLLDNSELITAATDKQARRIYSTTVQIKNNR
ncbi:PilW family protein [Oceanicoccus sagamiensis]|uniref:Pilus assembly protein PilW n=1 Tax=Oceanicoccus sagamiensis TaxID=716816 RepID=A0A1X9N6G2_9GAMM|nr:PilW family protein [Oceanicoccus sagamiensis]ARN72841.1 hypothetical protein BST96_01205 [Oceanicoccus sagamiensis]